MEGRRRKQPCCAPVRPSYSRIVVAGWWHVRSEGTRGAGLWEEATIMAWELFNWGSRGPWYKTGVDGIYMAHIFIPNGVRVVLRGQGTSGQELLHTFHALNPAGTPDYAFCLGAATTVSQWVTNFYRHFWASGIACRDVTATGMDTVPAAQAQVSNTIAGDRIGISLPSQTSLRLKFGTNTSGRRHEGGASLWPANENDYLDEDRYTTAYVNAAIATFTQLVALMNTNGSPLSIGSLADAKVYPILRVVAIDDIMDSRRRRTNTRGA